MTIYVHKGDLPASVKLEGDLAVDCEMMGLDFFRDRLCLVQIADGKGDAHLIQIAKGQTEAPRLQALLEDPARTKIFHYARYDLSALQIWLSIDVDPIYCTKTASRLCRTYADKHSHKVLLKELLGIDANKEEQLSDWGCEDLTDKQKEYAAADVLYLHQLRAKLEVMLAREGRTDLAQACFNFLPIRAALDMAGWNDQDIFAHH